MGTYKEDSDRLHAMMEQRERDLASAETLERFVALLEANGVDVDKLTDALGNVDAALKRAGLPLEFRRSVARKAFEMKLGLSGDGSTGPDDPQ